MIVKVIEASLKHKFLVLLFTLALVAGGIFAIKNIPIDAIPDLSDVQVIVYTEYPGQAPQVVEDQVTYPLSSSMLAVPHAKVVRGYSFFGFSLVYIIFEDGTDLYWARSRVLEYLNFASSRLASNVKPQLGPDATGVGWVYMYTVQDTSGKYNLQQLRSIQDWNIRYELQSIQGVSEVASIGGYVKQYQVEVDPTKLLLHGISLANLRDKLSKSNLDVGGRLIEMGETEYMVRGLGYIKNTEDIRSIVLKADKDGNPITVGDIAHVQIGPEIRRGIAELDGEGEVVSGIVMIRFGENALEVIGRIKQRIQEMETTLPKGVVIRGSYDRSKLIHKAVSHISWKLVEEMAVVALVIVIFLLHARSALVAMITLPIGVLASLFVMYLLQINANIMSLGGIAIAIGVMVDASVVMVENLHKHLEKDKGLSHLEIVRRASVEVGSALFYSLLIITVSFLPVLVLEGQSGRLFKPLAITKTLSMAFASLLAITVIPVLMSWFVKGKVWSEKESPISLFLTSKYRLILGIALQQKQKVFLLTGIFLLLTLIPLKGIPKWQEGYWVKPIGGEFMPPLNEGDLLYMPTTLPGLSITKAKELLQKTDAIIKSFPEVQQVIGKIGRAETATDPAPLTMIETTILLKDKSQWRDGMTIDKLTQELDNTIQFPGLTNAWTFPIRTRIDMLSTGIKTPVGIKLLGDDLQALSRFGSQLEGVLNSFPGTASVISERVTGGNYIDFQIDRKQASRYGLTIGDIQDTIMTAIGGRNVTWTVEGLARYPINIRYPREYRDDISKLRNIWVTLPNGAYIPITHVASIAISSGPPSIKTENARKTAWIFIDLKPGRDVASYVEAAKQFIHNKIKNKEIVVPHGVSIQWSGQYEYMERAKKRLTIAGVVTVFVIVLLLYFHFGNFTETAIILLSLLFAVTGGIWLLYVLGYNRSVATDIGFIALAGLAAETGIVMLLYLDGVFQRYACENQLNSPRVIRKAVIEGAVDRVRPKVMTVATTLLGLLPIMWASESGSRVMKRLAAPMIGGLVTSTILTLVLIPLVYESIQIYRLRKGKT
ncbi:MAG: CusA/CzcA family heavy metal efflux RND transporter [Spirochaetota bacterium]